MMMVGGFCLCYIIFVFDDLGMEVIGIGYEFGYGDDYKCIVDYV